MQDRVLDAMDGSPHFEEMAQDEVPKSKAGDREKKLAQALRANLRRRKLGTEPGRAPESPPKSGEEA